MSTNAYIAVQCADGIRAIYCHSDGYQSHCGKMLTTYYNTPALASELVNLGDLSRIGPKIGEVTSFDDPAPDQCVFYGRDRGEDDTEFELYSTQDEFIDMFKHSYAEWAYIFDNGKWKTIKG